MKIEKATGECDFNYGFQIDTEYVVVGLQGLEEALNEYDLELVIIELAHSKARCRYRIQRKS